MPRPRVSILIVLMAVAALAGLGCSPQRPPEEMKDTLVYGYFDQVKTFDPTRQQYSKEASVIVQVLQQLVRYGSNRKLEPLLAVAWEPSEECRVWTFFLRPGVLFHDGTPFDASAVKAHFDRTMDPAVAATRRKRIEVLRETEVVDPLTVRFHLNEPNCVFPEVLTGSFAVIPSPTAVAKYGADFGSNPVGTGPFVFVRWIPDVLIELRRNPDYWDPGRIHIERLIMRRVQEHTTRLIQLEQGLLDMADISSSHVQVVKESKEIELQSVPMLSIRYVGFNTQKPPFNDKRVRQAANYAINKEDLIRYVFFGVGEPARGPIPSVIESFNHDMRRYDYDPEKARALLKEAGYPEGFVAEFWSRESGEYKQLSEAVMGSLREVGIDVRMITYDNAAYWDKFDAYIKRSGEQFPEKAGVYDMYVGGWAGGETAHGFLEPLFKSYSYSNSSFYINEEVDRLLGEYRYLPDPAERDKVYRRIQEIVVEEAPWIFAYHGQINIGVRDRVKNFRVSPADWLFFEDVTLDDGPAAEEDGGRP